LTIATGHLGGLDRPGAVPIDQGEGPPVGLQLDLALPLGAQLTLPASVAPSIFRDKDRRRIGKSQPKQQVAGRNGRRRTISVRTTWSEYLSTAWRR
jgi:hypothetical protein